MGIEGAVSRVRFDLPGMPEEIAAVSRAVSRRKAEFITGRYCARQALKRIGVIAAGPILKGNGGLPIWPDGVVGSISHTSELVIAIVGRTGQIHAVGIDVERMAELAWDVNAMVTAPGDAAFPVGALLEGSLRFACKEAAFKCWYVAGGARIIEFSEARLEVSGNSFVAIMPTPGPSRIEGRWAMENGHWWCVAWC